MNKNQKIVIMIGLIVIVLMGVVPPWVHTVSLLGSQTKYSAGYSPIISAPSRQYDAPAYGVSLDISRLLMQWALVGMVAGGLVLILKDKDEK